MNQDIRVMLVDDDPIVRECITAFLEDEGFTVVTADSAEDALVRLRETHCQVCITDLRLPGMGGEEFILRTMSDPAGPHCLIHTGSDYQVSDELRAVGMTGDDVLYKPVYELERISEAIRRAASTRRA